MKKPRNGESIVTGNSLQNDHKLHITGEGYKAKVEKVEGFESADDFNVKTQVAKPATIQITSIILDNLNRWTTASGTVKKIDFKDKAKNDKFKDVLAQVWRGDSFEKFISTFYKEAIYTEFNGFALATKPKILKDNLIERDGIITRKKEGNLDPYIIFIAISDTYDFYITGDKVEYLIIKIGENTYRLIDDEKDVVFDWNKSKETLIIESEIPNELGYVPARKISGINKNILSSQVKTSPIDHILPALNRYFSSDADLRMQFIRHNYPKLAIVTKECGTCNGQGKVPEFRDGHIDTSTLVNCNACDGTGKVVPISRGGVIGLPQNLLNGDTPYPGTPASYITPDTDSLRLGLDDLKEQWKNLVYAGTGDKNLISESLNTATENLINSRSLEDRIKEITQMVESFETFMIKAIKDLHKDFTAITDYFITIRYGKRISIKNESELIKEIDDSKKAGMPSSYISALHKDLIYVKYKNNAQELSRQLLLADVEPLSGYTIDELEKAKEDIYPRDLYVKVNFDSLVTEIEQTTPLLYFMPDSDYRDKVVAINNLIDEILQRRDWERSPGGGQTMDETAQGGAENQKQGMQAGS